MRSPPTFEHLLIIDDDAILRELLTLLLASRIPTVTAVESGEAALDLLQALSPAERPSILLVDVNLPGIAGSELAARLRPVCPLPALLFAMSASTFSPQIRAAFDDFLLKPFTVEDFYTAVERAHANSDLPSDVLPAAADKTPSGAATLPPLDESIYLKLSSIMGPPALFELYDLFVKDVTMRLDRLRSAAATGEADVFTREAHAIKGSCGMLGATELQSMAGRMETEGLAPLHLDPFAAALTRLHSILIAKVQE